MFNLLHDIKDLAIDNEFSKMLSHVAFSLGSNLIPFGIGDPELKEYGVLQLDELNDFTGSDTMGRALVKHRKDAYKNWGIHIDEDNKDHERFVLLDYMLSCAVCYVEVPKWSAAFGERKRTYDKAFYTRNPRLISLWSGDPIAEVERKCSQKIAMSQGELSLNKLRAIRLNDSSKGKTLTVPRSPIDLAGARVVPLFMIASYLRGILPTMEENILCFKYLKDNGTLRELNTTLSDSIMKDYYSDVMYVSNIMGYLDVNKTDYFGLKLSSKASRGYIRVPEVGASIYDASGTRSLNLARLVSVEKVAEVDRSYINVDLDSAPESFLLLCEQMVNPNPEYLQPIYNAITGNTDIEFISSAEIITALRTEVATKTSYLSTTYKRSLHEFMVSHPEWFSHYTGKPITSVASSQSYGVGVMDF